MNSKCSLWDELAVVFLSNFSINNNFSHFLHGLLRLFCALIDAHLIIWDLTSQRFVQRMKYSIWLDEYWKLNPTKIEWLSSLGGSLRFLGKEVQRGDCIGSTKLIYGSGCVKLLPPEKWFGYPGCRANKILPAFGYYMRQIYNVSNDRNPIYFDGKHTFRVNSKSTHLNINFAVRSVGDLTGKRAVSNLFDVQNYLQTHINVNAIFKNITFEHLPISSTIKTMADTHILISVHGAGLTNMFFMKPGTAVIEM